MSQLKGEAVQVNSFIFLITVAGCIVWGGEVLRTKKPGEFSCNVPILKWEGSELTWITYDPSISP